LGPRFSDLGLGARIADVWTSRRRDERLFPEIARAALEEARLHEAYDFDTLVAEVLRADPLPMQNNGSESFGQPPVTIFRGEGFIVELLFWIDGLVSVHQHGFSGAFLVFEGSSIHSRYRFTEHVRVSSAMVFGELAFAEAELLRRGDIRTIEAGPSLIHATFHLERPTITVVVRTNAEHPTGPQYDYHRPSLALDPFYSRPTLRKDLQVLRMLHRSRITSYWRAVETFLRRSDWLAAYLTLEQGYLLFRSPEDRARLFDVARAKHGAELEILLPILAASAERRTVIGWRDAESDEEVRFFLALLLTVPHRARLLELVAERFPKETPEDVVVRCMERLGFDEGGRILGRLLLSGTGRDELRKGLASANYRVANDYELLKAVRDLRSVPGFSALFSD
jgi:hypothetical protein